MRSIRLFLFFLVGAFLSGSAVFAFAGDRKSPIPVSALVLCSAESLKTSNYPVISVPCFFNSQYPECPFQKDGGSCRENAVFRWKVSASGGEYSWSANSEYSYCPDSAPSWNGSKCVAKDPCASKGGLAVDDGSVGEKNTRLSMNFAIREDGNYVGQTFCSGGCLGAVTKEVGSIGIGMAGRYYNDFNASFSGQSCPPPGVSVGPKTTPGLIQKTSKEYDCLAAGKSYGYVNEMVVCTTPSDKSGKASQRKETKNPDGTTTKTAVDKSVSCTGAGSCTTTTTTTTTVYNADGTQASTKSESQKETSTGQGAEGSGFCKENPSSPICKTGSFSGSCEAAPSCEGDPIQCATAKATWETNCKTMKPGEIKEAPDVGTKKIQQNFEHAELGGGGSCPAARAITLFGRSVYFEMTPICEFASGIRPVVILLGWISAGYIVMGYGRSSSQS